MSNNTNTTGLPPPTKQGHVGTPAQAAYNDSLQRNASNAALANSVGGGSKKKRGGAITVPVLQTSYKTTGSPEQSPTGIAASNGKVASQGNENAKYDNQLQQGGKRCKRGGNPDWIWGCYSGGKRRKTRTNKRKTRRYRKKTRRNKK